MPGTLSYDGNQRVAAVLDLPDGNSLNIEDIVAPFEETLEPFEECKISKYLVWGKCTWPDSGPGAVSYLALVIYGWITTVSENPKFLTKKFPRFQDLPR